MLMACLLCLSALGPSVSRALGLGEIHLNSALNEPMNADIDLIAAAPDELTALRATLASREAFTRYGIDKPAFLSSFTFKVGKGKDGRDALLVRSTDAIPEPFVTFLVEVNWSRGRLMREYTVLLDPPVYTPGEPASAAAPIAAPLASAPSASASAGTSPTSATPPVRRAAPPSVPPAEAQPSTATTPAPATGSYADSNGVRVGQGDTLSRIVRNLHPDASPAAADQMMIAMYRSNPDAFGGNINILRRGAILRVPNADQVAALNQREAVGEVHRQIEAWRSSEGAAAGRLRLVTPVSGGTATGSSRADAGNPNPNSAETQALKERVKELEAQLAESKRLIEIRSGELSALQHKVAAQPAPPAAAPPVAAPPAVPSQPSAPVSKATPPVTPPPAVVPTPVPVTPEAPAAAKPVAPTPVAPAPKKPAAPADTGSWIDWVTENWWAPVALLAALVAGIVLAAIRRRRAESDGLGALAEATDEESRDPTAKLKALRRGNESFVVEESGEHPTPDFTPETGHFDPTEVSAPEDTLSSENAVNLDQGDPLAEADFHMAYGLYDQAADLVRIALEREPERRDLRLKLLEIYFVWGNKDAFLQTAKGLEATRDRAPAGEWDKIVIMGKQICPDEPMFGAAAGSGRGAGALVDLNLEGGENRVDIDLFGDPEGERSSLDHAFEKESDHTSTTSESPGLRSGADLDFTLDAPERGADDSPTREMPPRDEPTVESELMNFGHGNFLDGDVDAPTAETPHLRGGDKHDFLASKLPNKADQTAEVSIDDLGLDLDSLETTGTPSISIPSLAATDHPPDAPTMMAGLDERSRRMMADAEKSARDRDLTELERDLESSFIADLDTSHDDMKTAILKPELAPTVLMPRDVDQNATSRFTALDETEVASDNDTESTSKLRGLNPDNIDLDLDRLASALGAGDTVDQPRAAEDLFSSEVFEGTQRNKLVDLDVGEALVSSDSPTNKLQAQTGKLKPVDLGLPEIEPVTMSEVGTKLDLARAYMDMGDPEGARSILEEVVQEGSASQKQEASRLIESLPG